MPSTRLAPPPLGRRVRASLGDLVPIAGWFALLTGVGAAVRALVTAAQAPPVAVPLLATDVAVFAMTVLPVGLYLVAGEARHQASRGKRRAGLRVVTVDGGRPSARRVVGPR